MVDPFREHLLSHPDRLTEQIAQCAEPATGNPAFDPEAMKQLASRIRIPEDARFESPLLEQVVRIGLAHINATFKGDHPKYGVRKGYDEQKHDAFPPTIISTVDALTMWDDPQRAQTLFGYWLNTFVRPDGTIHYYGPSLSEYGQLLTTARRLVLRRGDPEWLKANSGPLERMAAYLRDLFYRNGKAKLLPGIPEADEEIKVAAYFHNNAWCARGLTDWAWVLRTVFARNDEAASVRQDALKLQGILNEILNEVWPSDPSDWWLRPTLEEQSRPGFITETRIGGYTNWRYWPELLSSGVLPEKWCERIITARLCSGGQFIGTSRLEQGLADWPLYEHLNGLWRLGKRDDFRLCLWGHIRFSQDKDHRTAYECISFPPGRPEPLKADYCLPVQLVAVRAAGLLCRPKMKFDIL